MRKRLLFFFFIISACLYTLQGNSYSFILKEGDQTFIIDRQGEQWDITQAVSIGFKPENFQFGLGRNAFTPLDDSFLRNQTENMPSDLRILGVSDDAEVRAYSIPRLRGHEIANSVIGSKPIAVGY